ncbi:Mannan endo-1,4-beta-mannosidase 2 [Senna tora]|uniref:Mannan endo-1,4-beta-mannosidase 2 n=1 Tax=Senna tora TaxID=362788 RepID=A0A834STX3_9FABA|nr:Mannan endo-1,4-beta-mannosidase 2 [Senna tora]
MAIPSFKVDADDKEKGIGKTKQERTRCAARYQCVFGMWCPGHSARWLLLEDNHIGEFLGREALQDIDACSGRNALHDIDAFLGRDAFVKTDALHDISAFLGHDALVKVRNIFSSKIVISMSFWDAMPFLKNTVLFLPKDRESTAGVEILNPVLGFWRRDCYLSSSSITQVVPKYPLVDRCPTALPCDLLRYPAALDLIGFVKIKVGVATQLDEGRHLDDVVMTSPKSMDGDKFLVKFDHPYSENKIGCFNTLSPSSIKFKTTDRAMQCLPVIRIDVNRGEIDIWNFGIANKIKPKSGCPLLWVDN